MGGGWGRSRMGPSGPAVVAPVAGWKALTPVGSWLQFKYVFADAEMFLAAFSSSCLPTVNLRPLLI